MDSSNENLIAAFRSSGKTQNDFCTEQNIPIERLRYYLYKKDKQKKHRRCTKLEKRTPAGPTFISFKGDSNNHQVSTHSLQRYSVTIIRGTFSATELSSLLSTMDTGVC